MNPPSLLNESNNYEEMEEYYPIRNLSNTDLGKNLKKGSNSKKKAMVAELNDQQEHFDFSYHASRHERVWITQSLGDFFEQHWFDDILRLIKGGKEANVYHCLANPSVQFLENPFIAAKVYRPRRFRNLKNDHIYREGRAHLDGDGNLITDDGMLHAISKRTEFGLELSHTSWIEHEVKTINLLFSAGADVPRVFASGNNAILMTYIGDEETAAPTLHGIRLSPRHARKLFEKVVHNIDLMLSLGRVHGDLSAYNILFWENEITIIDFPQAIDPNTNRNAYWIFERDVFRICDYFARQGVKSDARQIASSMWKKHQLRTIPDVHPGLLDSENEGDRTYWNDWTADL